jgi:hypothetical protein
MDLATELFIFSNIADIPVDGPKILTFVTFAKFSAKKFIANKDIIFGSIHGSSTIDLITFFFFSYSFEEVCKICSHLIQTLR